VRALPTPPVPFRLVTASTASDPTDPQSSVRAVPYKGGDLDAERGPGLGCFRFQLVVLATLIVLTPIGVAANWPFWLTAGLLFATIGLLLVAGQTIIFLLRLVAADRRGRRRPLASATRTVGELEDESAEEPRPSPGEPSPGEAPLDEPLADEPLADEPLADEPSVRQ
jgi:hypothetical protein